MKNIIISDSTLRDGNHAIRHQLKASDISDYCRNVDSSGVDIVEVGHGNGLGASSLTLGRAGVTDVVMLETARAELTNTLLGIHFIPGFGRQSDLDVALSCGVDIFRVACHCTEVNITERYIDYVKNAGKKAFGVLMMSHMLEPEETVENALLLESYGVDALVLMDSAGHLMPSQVGQRFSMLTQELDIAVGFHAHNNLGMAVANSIEAVTCGAEIIDACIKGFGAGAGNTQLEVLVAVFERLGISTNASLEKVVELAHFSECFITEMPTIMPGNILSGRTGLFSGYSKHVARHAEHFKLSEFDIYEALKERNLVAGQEDIILEVASNLFHQKNEKVGVDCNG